VVIAKGLAAFPDGMDRLVHTAQYFVGVDGYFAKSDKDEMKDAIN